MKILYMPNQYSQQRQREKARWIWPVHLAMEATWNKMIGHGINWGDPLGHYDKVITDIEGIPFESLPAPDRKLTNAFDPKYQNNGNFKYHPGTYIQSAAGCWWGKCEFCKEKGISYKVRDVHEVIKEIAHCKRQGFKEIFDDAATLADGMWREKFIHALKRQDVAFSCNMRFGTFPDFIQMKEAGFRMLLYGMESASQDTLDRINKGVNIDDAIKELILASRYGLEPHIAVMFGIPGETEEDALRTLYLVQMLLRKGYAKTAQASLYNVPGVQNENYQKYVPMIYRAAYYPDFWINKLKDIRNIDDVKYIWRGIKSCFGI